MDDEIKYIPFEEEPEDKKKQRKNIQKVMDLDEADGLYDTLDDLLSQGDNEDIKPNTEFDK